jgi:hypothetical protein
MIFLWSFPISRWSPRLKERCTEIGWLWFLQSTTSLGLKKHALKGFRIVDFSWIHIHKRLPGVFTTGELYSRWWIQLRVVVDTGDSFDISKRRLWPLQGQSFITRTVGYFNNIIACSFFFWKMSSPKRLPSGVNMLRNGVRIWRISQIFQKMLNPVKHVYWG